MRVFLANEDIETINGVSIDKYRKIYATGNYEKVYRAICLAELRQRKQKAIAEKNAGIYADYLDRKELYEYDQVYMGTAVSRRPAFGKFCAIRLFAKRRSKKRSRSSKPPVPRRLCQRPPRREEEKPSGPAPR